MAAKKKRSPKAKKSAPKKKPAVKKKSATKVRKKVAPRTKPKTTRTPARTALKTPKQAAPAPKPAAPAALPGEERLGRVTHYYSHLSVAVVQMESGTLRVGDTIHIKGHTSDFRQRVDSMQIEHASIAEVRAGQEFGLRVNEHAREHDAVYKVTAP